MLTSGLYRQSKARANARWLTVLERGFVLLLVATASIHEALAVQSIRITTINGVFVPLASPLQSINCCPESGTGVSVTLSPLL